MKNLKLILSIVIIVVAISACNTKSEKKETALTETKVTVYYFHGEQRCPTCIAVGEVSSELVKAKYIDNKDVSFIEVDYSTKDGEPIADKYEIATSSLLIVSGGKVTDITNDAFAFAKNDPDKLKKILEDEINKNL
jgi:thiol-disulfide isomerase/thioredoxin